jgi:hypothetical protein
MPKKVMLAATAAKMLPMYAMAWSAVVPPLAMAQDRPLSAEELKAAGNAARQYVPKDQFDSPPGGPRWAGRKFSYVVEPQAWVLGARWSCAGFPDWSYLDGSLTVAARPEFVISYQLTGATGPLFPGGLSAKGRNELNISSVECTRPEEASDTASNAFGAKFDVKRWTDRVVGIADTDDPDFKFRPYWKAKIEGDAARQLARGLRARISGTLSSWPGGQTVMCGTHRTTPTVSTPIDRTLDACIFHGRIEMIEFFDAATGRVHYSATRNRK